MGGVSLEITVVLLLILVNGVLAMAEIAVVSARRARLQRLAERGSRGAAKALRLAENPTRFLSTVQVGITLVGILAGAFGGATIARTLAAYIAGIPRIGEHSEAISLGLVVLAITYLSLIIGELVPKRVALNNPERVASAMAGPMELLAKISSPVVRLLSGSTDLLLKLLPLKQTAEPAVTEEEIRTMIALGTKSGLFHQAEREMVDAVFRLGDRKVVELMTPRTKVAWLDQDEPAEDAIRRILDTPFSRFPVGKGSLDRCQGFVQARDLLAAIAGGGSLQWTDHLRQPMYVPEGFPALRLVELFRSAKVQLAFVIGEHGDVMGIVTTTDLLEAIVGDLPAPHEEHEPRVVRREDGSLLVDGMLSIPELKSLLSVEERLPAEGEYNTLGGFVMHQLGRVPSIGDKFRSASHEFEVVDMDARRVDRVLIRGETAGQDPS